MRKMITDTKARGATPIVLSLTVRSIWKDGKVERGSGHYLEWSRALAAAENTAFYDLTDIVADRYDSMSEETVREMFPKDGTHTDAQGADLNARFVVAGLKGLRENAMIKNLSAQGRLIEPAPPHFVTFPHLTRPQATDHDAFMRWLNLPDPADPALASLFLVGDSTVRNGRSDGVDGPGQWGWGDPLAAYFDPSKINLVNRAVGGTGAWTFLDTGYWDEVTKMLKPGDLVLMQFGHNDNGPRGALPGTDESTKTRNGKTVHTFGWYLRRYIGSPGPGFRWTLVWEHLI
jgi:lysophospholipase L1-like esterase